MEELHSAVRGRGRAGPIARDTETAGRGEAEPAQQDNFEATGHAKGKPGPVQRDQELFCITDHPGLPR